MGNEYVYVLTVVWGEASYQVLAVAESLESIDEFRAEHMKQFKQMCHNDYDVTRQVLLP